MLFACGLNSVRSPIAAGLFSQIFGRAIYLSASAGVRKGELDPFAVAVMDEIGVDISRHKPMTFEDVDEWEGLNFDLIVTLAPEAHHRALELTRTSAVDVEYWPTADPSATEGSRAQRLEAYREVRDQLLAHIRQRFVRSRRRKRVNQIVSRALRSAKRSVVVRSRPGSVRGIECGTIPDRRCTATRCTASGRQI